MPYSIKTKDGITINNIPDDIKPDSQVLKDRVASIRAGNLTPIGKQQQQPAANEPTAQPAQPTLGQPLDQSPAVTSTDEPKTMADVVNKMNAPRDVALTVASGIPAATVGAIQAIPDFIGAVAGAAKQGELGNIDANSRIADITNKAMERITSLGYQPESPEAQKIMRDVVQPVMESLMGVAPNVAEMGAIGEMAPAVARQVGAAVRPGLEMARDVAAPVMKPIKEYAQKTAQEDMAAIQAAKEADIRAAAKRQEMAADVANIEKQGMIAKTSDIAPKQTFFTKWVSGMAEKIPYVGTAELNKAGQAKRVSAVEKLFVDHGEGDAATLAAGVTADLLKNRDNQLKGLWKAKDDLKSKFDEFGAVPVNNAVAEIDKQIASLESLKTNKTAPAIEALTDFKNAIQQGQGIDNIEALRKQLGESYKSPNMVDARDYMQKASGQVYNALRDDIYGFIKDKGSEADLVKWKAINKRLEIMNGDLKNNALKSLLRKGDVKPLDVEKMLFSKDPTELSLLNKNLTEEGRRNARAAIIARAYEKSKGSPDVFANEMERMKRPIDIFFTGEDKQRVNGLIRALNKTKDQGRAALNPPTGVQTAVPLVGMALTDIFGSMGAAMASGASVGLISRIYESAPVRNILLRLPKTKAGSAEEAALLNKLHSEIEKQSTGNKQ